MSVPQDQPELDVDEDEEERVKDGVDHRQAQSDVGWHGRAQSRQGLRVVRRPEPLLLRQSLHDLLSVSGVRRSGGDHRQLLRLHGASLSALVSLSRPAEERDGSQRENRRKGEEKTRLSRRARREKTQQVQLPAADPESEARDQR